MAIMELKLPMLKHSRATSMKSSNTWVRCFFFTAWAAAQPPHEPTRHPSSPKAALGPQSCQTHGWGHPQAAEAGNAAMAFPALAEGQEGRLRVPRGLPVGSQAMLGSVPSSVALMI